MGIGRAAGVVGREEELAVVERFLGEVCGGPRALIVEGAAGIGKTTIWGHGVALARDKLGWVLTCCPTEAETGFAYAGLTDLLEGVLAESLPQLPVPQRRALEVALLRAEGEVDPRALSSAVLSVLRALGSLAPVLVAIDDVQWLDSSTAQVLDFAFRRIEHEPVLILASRRSGARHCGSFDLERGLGSGNTERLAVGPLGVDAVAQLLRMRLDRSPARPTLMRIHRACGGNPFFAIEIARAVLDSPHDVPSGELPLPEILRGLVHARLARLAQGTREVLLCVSALAHPMRAVVEAAVGPRAAGALAEAEAADVIVIERGRIRFTHPLLSAALYAEASSEEKRKIHRLLASVVADAEERARHLARAAAGPGEKIAGALEAAAESARSRGAFGAAADLAEQALRLTPAGTQAVHRRQVLAAEYLQLVGDYERAHCLLDEAIAALEPSPLRARALVALGMIEKEQHADWDRATETIERALEEVGDDLELRATTERMLAWQPASGYRARRAEAHADKAVRAAEELGNPMLIAEALAALAAVEFQRGRGVRFDLIDRALALEAVDAHASLSRQPRWAIAGTLMYAGLLDQARECYQVLLRVARERGEEGAIPWVLSLLAELEFHAGNWPLAEQTADEALTIALQTDQQGPAANVRLLRAELAVARGRADEARPVLEELGQKGEPVIEIFAHRLLALLELSRGNAAGALLHFPPIHDAEEALGIGDPAIHRFAADEIEVLIAVGRLDDATRLLADLRRRGEELDRTWALATAARCRGLLLVEQGDYEGALRALEQALREHERLPLPLERGRTLLVKGKIERRAKERRAARQSLEAALEIFDCLGATLWAKQARAERARIGGRASSAGLTPTEQQIADFVAAGSTNREVAEAMFISVKTVEASLSRIYRKLVVASRRELTRQRARQT